MFRADTHPHPRSGEVALSPRQLQPGVHVRLPLGWLDHPFVFNSFVIENERQVREIMALRLPEIFSDVARCKVPPLPLPVPEAACDPVADEDAERVASALAAKERRMKAMAVIREHLDTTCRHYLGASKAVGSAFKSFDANPRESIAEMAEVSQKSTTVLLDDVDSAIVLIAEKGHHDGFAAHALSVMTLSLLLGKQARLPEEALHALGVAALLHDIGQLAINPSILKNAERNRHEEAIYQTHCALGVDSIQRGGRASQSLLQAILHHHEHFDGSGFPDHLSGEQIHIAARVIAVANRFDNLANPIGNRHALSPSEALSRMWVREKDWFDPVLLQLFVRAMGVYPPGSVVELSDGRLGTVVISATADNLLAPQVMLYEPDVPRAQAIIVDLAQEDSVQIARAVRLQECAEEALDYLLPRRRMNWFAAQKE
ncbi:MAG: DUF3391 domain-containing protein [Burkholderiales bacterium]